MNPRTSLLFAVLLVLASAGAGLAGEATGVEHFGEQPPDDLEVTPIEAILSDPETWEGQRVHIAGKVSGVCSKQGCWMDLTSADDATLRVKVDDGVIVFPQAAVGRMAEAVGEVEILDMERAQYESWLRHAAEEEGRELDPAEVGEAPYRVVRLRGRGAEIAAP